MNKNSPTKCPEGLLTMAIPTFNRCAELSQLLQWIDQHAPQEVEVVVRDNASTDGTWQMLQQWSSTTRRKARIFRNPENLGIDYNILKVAEDCTTEWFWWMGDDDLFDPDIYKFIIGLIQQPNDVKILFLNYLLWDGTLPVKQVPPVFNLIQDKYYSKKIAQEAIMLLCETLGFISAIVVNRMKYLQHQSLKPDWINQTAFDFVYGIKSMIESYGIFVSRKPYIWYRSGSEPRGFDWINAAISIVNILGNKQYLLPKIKIKSKIGSVFLERSLIPRLRQYLRCNPVSFLTRIKIFLKLILPFAGCLVFWSKLTPRLFLIRFLPHRCI